MNKIDDNHSILNGVCEFVNLLLKEVLDKRCDFKELFYLPGLPVMEEELIFSMTEGSNYAQSTSTLKNMWKSLLEVIKTIIQNCRIQNQYTKFSCISINYQ